MNARLNELRRKYRGTPVDPPTVHRHRGHHIHLHGTMVECSCGEQHGITCVAFEEDAPMPVCEECGKEWCTYMGPALPPIDWDEAWAARRCPVSAAGNI